jgi:hypothetical protein
MIPHQPEANEQDEQVASLTRRSLLHRSALSIAGIGLGAILVACGGEEEEVDPPVPADNEADQPGEDTGPEPETSG